MPLLIACLAARRETLPLAAIPCATLRVSSINDAWGRTRLTMPIRSASAAGTILPVKIISLARLVPIRRDSRWVPPNPGMIPRVISGKPNMAFSEA